MLSEGDTHLALTAAALQLVYLRLALVVLKVVFGQTLLDEASLSLARLLFVLL